MLSAVVSVGSRRARASCDRYLERSATDLMSRGPACSGEEVTVVGTCARHAREAVGAETRPHPQRVGVSHCRSARRRAFVTAVPSAPQRSDDQERAADTPVVNHPEGRAVSLRPLLQGRHAMHRNNARLLECFLAHPVLRRPGAPEAQRQWRSRTHTERIGAVIADGRGALRLRHRWISPVAISPSRWGPDLLTFSLYRRESDGLLGPVPRVLVLAAARCASASQPAEADGEAAFLTPPPSRCAMSAIPRDTSVTRRPVPPRRHREDIR